MTHAGVFDIECAAWDRFLVGEILDADGQAFQSWDERDFFDALISRRGVYYAHAGGRYDALWALEQCERRGIPWTAKTRGAGVLSARIGDLELRDSYAIVPMKLASGAALGGATKHSLSLPCECGLDCGGYCALSRELTDTERRLVGEYLHHDCVALDAMMSALYHRAEIEQITLRLTIGSTAYATARDWLGLPPSEHDLGRYRALREGYYGGRTECFRPRAAQGQRYDIHSSYPAALTRVALPHGPCLHLNGLRAGNAYSSGWEGVFWARVTIPEAHVPPLPVRQPDRLLYPYGPAEGAWTGLELRYAESCGVVVERVTRALAWREASPLLREYAQRVWDLRATYAQRGEKSWASWFKWLANSLTGKLAQRPEHGTLHYVASVDGQPPEVPEGAEILRVTPRGVFMNRETVRVDPCAHVQWSAYLTAEARTELHRQLTHAGDPIYCDTDSVYAPHTLTRRVGDELGEWGHEGELYDWRCLAPKVYRYRDERGDWHVRGKGLSGLTPEGFDLLAAGGVWDVDRGVDGLRTRIRRGDGLFRRKAIKRGLHPIAGWTGGRIVISSESTRPPTVAEYEGRYQDE